MSDKTLGKIIYNSYRYTWVFFGGMFISQFINYFVTLMSNNLIILSFILGFLLAELIENSIGKVIKKLLIKMSEYSKNPLNKRLYGLFDGWSAFLTAFIIMLLLNGVFKINPPFIPGPYIFLIPISGIILFASVTYAVITKRT